MDNLIAFWNFQEPAGQPRMARIGGSADAELALREHPGVGRIERVSGGIFGPWCARMRSGQWLIVPRIELGPLDIHGNGAQVSVVAWVRRRGIEPWQAIAGAWDETRSKRQYCLFLNALSGTHAGDGKRYPMSDRIHGHVSGVGGPTPGHPFCNSYSSGASAVPVGEWACIAMTYDGEYSRVYRDGRLDALADFNPFPYGEGVFDGGADGADFTVGAVHRGGEWGNFFDGDIAGLAVFDRAVSESELVGWKASFQEMALSR